MATTTSITPTSPFIAPPRITRRTFKRVLQGAGSPWAGRAREIYGLIATAGQDPAVWLAICAREHRYGTERDSVLWRNDTRSWTNARSVRDPALTGWEIVVDPVRKSPYVRYRDVLDSVRDGLYRVADSAYRYVRENRRSIGEVLEIWTESGGDGYAVAVVEHVNAWMAQERANAYAAIVPGLVDVRDRLARREPGGPPSGPHESRTLGQKRGVVVHYSGPPVADRVNALGVLHREARYHVGKNWAAAGERPLLGDGLMYHVAVGDDGAAYLCRDLEAVLWHCGAWPQNALALSVHLPIGGDQRATPAQLQALRQVVDAWREVTGTPRAEVWGHRELSPTSCPGTLMADFVYPYRGEGMSMSDGHWFPETGYYVGNAFWQFWHERGGLPIFGYPLSNELREDDRTVQYFERAVFEWHSENPDPYKVLLRRVGAEALERRAG